MEPLIGQIIMFAGNFAPRGWALCNGQLLSISQNTALFSILGTSYGGDGRTTFALPDLRGRFPMSSGQGPGLSDRPLGETSGQENATLTTSNMPQHNHTLSASESEGTSANPQSRVFALATASADSPRVYNEGPVNVRMLESIVGPAGQNQPFSIMPPFEVVNFIIALEGIFPARD